jgi:hypothetical protein
MSSLCHQIATVERDTVGVQMLQASGTGTEAGRSEKSILFFARWNNFQKKRYSKNISNWFFMTPSIATKFQYINSL